MYREDGQEIVVALDVASGETVWEHRYDATPNDGHITRFGEGPRATPLIVGNRIYTVGVAGRMLRRFREVLAAEQEERRDRRAARHPRASDRPDGWMTRVRSGVVRGMA